MTETMGDSIDFEDIVNLIYRREMNRVYEFNLMLVGVTGIGKSTLVKSLFQGMIEPEDTNQGPKLNEYAKELEENRVKLRLRCIETSNYDRHNSGDYVKYIDEQLKTYFKAQRRQSTWNIIDTRVHCCLYMIPPYGKMKLRKEDLDCMKALHEKVNLIPLIAKADTFSSLQLEKFKENILTDLELNGIKYFKFHHDLKEDEDRFKSVKDESEKFPFAIVAAEEPIREKNKKLSWIRNTIAGEIDISDSKKCDFDALAKLLIRHCMLDLIDSTHVVHYAKYKTEVLDLAMQQGNRNLEIMGLQPHEIKRIEYDNNPKGSRLTSNQMTLDRKRAEMEKELEGLRRKLQEMRNYRRTSMLSA